MKHILCTQGLRACVALALLTGGLAFASFPGLEAGIKQPEPTGVIVEGTCPSRHTNVRMHGAYDPDRQHIRTFKNPGFITRCVELAAGVKPVEGWTAVLGRDVDGHFKVLAVRETPAKH